MIKKQHSARPMMTIALLALMLYKLLITPVMTPAHIARTNPTASLVHSFSAHVNQVAVQVLPRTQ